MEQPLRGAALPGTGRWRALPRSTFAAALAGAAALAACDTRPPAPTTPVPGATASAETRALDAGAAVLQDKPPIDALNAYLDGFHFYSGQIGRQVEAHHYCGNLNEELIQCVIYDGNGRDAKLVGIEYVVSGRLFRTLPEREKALWHSHVHEVKSGQLLAPGIPLPAEHALMERLVGTYGKTWHTWHAHDGASLPLGVPQLMMGFTADGQLDPARLAARDQRVGIDSAARRADRADIETPPIAPGADAWQQGRVLQLPDPTADASTSRQDPRHDR
jgi:hypothetical protein